MLHPPGARRERILAYGEANSGKTSIWLAVAKWIARTQSKSHLYVMDTDVAWEAMRPVDGSLDKIVTVYDCENYPDYKKAIGYVRKTANKEDFLVLDMADKLWSASQQHYFGEVFESDLGDYFLEAKKGGATVAGEYGTNWNVINKLYNDVMMKVHRFPGHLIACTPAAEIRQPNREGKGGDSDEVRKVFGRFGLKPQGQKDLPHLFHTVILMQEAPDGWRMTAVKDRQRERIAGEMVKPDFVMAYLVKVAGWVL